MGSLGSRNHFLEVQKVEEIFDEEAARAFGLFESQTVVITHTGSRGCGHQVCQDHLDCVLSASKREGIDLPDKQLASAPLYTKEAQEYFKNITLVYSIWLLIDAYLLLGRNCRDFIADSCLRTKRMFFRVDLSLNKQMTEVYQGQD